MVRKYSFIPIFWARDHACVPSCRTTKYLSEGLRELSEDISGVQVCGDLPTVVWLGVGGRGKKNGKVGIARICLTYTMLGIPSSHPFFHSVVKEIVGHTLDS